MKFDDKILSEVLEQTIGYLKDVDSAPIGVNKSKDEILGRIDTKLPIKGEDALVALGKLSDGVKAGLLGNQNPRFFGFVMGGTSPTALAADWLASAWNQCAFMYNSSPAAAIFEEIVMSWLLDLLSLPDDSSIGFVTGGQMANFTAINIARNTILEKCGWNFDENGMQGTPLIYIYCADVCHGTLLSAIRMNGFGEKNIIKIDTDFEGRMRVSDLAEKLKNNKGPKIICSQAGNVNTGSFDSFEEIADLAHLHDAWHHVDGAFGLWARVTPVFSEITKGLEKADSWTVDAHKWLSVPFDIGMIITRHKESLASIKKVRCAYSGKHDDSLRDCSQWGPENSKRARGFVLYATIRNFGKEGIQEIIERNCELAHQLAKMLNSLPYASVLNEVHLNQVLCHLKPEGVNDLDLFHQKVAKRIQEEGSCWLGTSVWKGSTVLRLSITNLFTTAKDIQITFDSIKTAIEYVLQYDDL
jgi:glutamate/tyrosine decarboxylase-like PLP-dependent enzyme